MIRTTLIEKLGQLERETNLQYDSRWDLLARGSVSAADVEILRSASVATQSGRAMFAAFSPLDASACDRIAERIIATRPKPSGARVISLPRVPSGVFAAAAAMCLAAASAGLIFGLPAGGPRQVAQNVAPSAPGPRYRLEIAGGDVPGGPRDIAPLPSAVITEAGESPRTTLLGPGASMTLLLRPDRPNMESASVLACLKRGGVTSAWKAAWDRSDHGSFRAEGTRESLFPGEPPGQVALLFAVVPASEPTSCEALGADPSRKGLPLLSHRVILR